MSRSLVADLQHACELIERRLAAVQAAAEDLARERDRLQHALALIRDDRPAVPSQAARSSKASKASKARSSAKRAGRSKRGGRRSSSDRALAFLVEHPGSEAGALVAHLGLSQGTTYNLLGRMAKDGLIEKRTGGRRPTYFAAGTSSATTAHVAALDLPPAGKSDEPQAAAA